MDFSPKSDSDVYNQHVKTSTQTTNLVHSEKKIGLLNEINLDNVDPEDKDRIKNIIDTMCDLKGDATPELKVINPLKAGTFYNIIVQGYQKTTLNYKEHLSKIFSDPLVHDFILDFGKYEITVKVWQSKKMPSASTTNKRSRNEMENKHHGYQQRLPPPPPTQQQSYQQYHYTQPPPPPPHITQHNGYPPPPAPPPHRAQPPPPPTLQQQQPVYPPPY